MVGLKSAVPTLINRDEEVVKTREENPEENGEDKETQNEETKPGRKNFCVIA